MRVHFVVTGSYEFPDYTFKSETDLFSAAEVAEETADECLREALNDYDADIHIGAVTVRAKV